VASDGGVRDVYDKGKFTHCKELEVWFHPRAFANMLSYSRISKIAKIKTISNGFTICWPSGKTWKCTTRCTHIYHYTLDGRTDLEMESDTLQQSKSFAALTFVAANKQMYTKRWAEKVKELEAMLAYPSNRKFKERFRSQCYFKLSCNLIRCSHRVSNICTKPRGISWKNYTKTQQNGGTAIK